MSKDLKPISIFNSLVKPNIHLKLHPYVENLTKINIEDLNNSLDFKSVYSDFINFIGKEENILVVWGSSDIKELVKNIEFYNLDSCKISNKYIDIQSYASKLFKLPKGQKISLKMLLAYNICEGDFHDAFYDAHYTAEVFKAIYTNKLSPSTFTKILKKT